MSKALLDARADYRHALVTYERTLREDYPIGAVIRWIRGSRMNNGIVTRHSQSDRVEVRNTLTNAKYWISAYDVLLAHEADSARKRA